MKRNEPANHYLKTADLLISCAGDCLNDAAAIIPVMSSKLDQLADAGNHLMEAQRLLKSLIGDDKPWKTPRFT